MRRGLLSLVWLGLAYAACAPSATVTGFAPVTSVVVHADSIIPAAQCGKGPNQIARYTAVVSACADVRSDTTTCDSPKVLAGQTYDCFADAQFANMLGRKFQLEVFLWSADAYLKAMTPSGGARPIGSVETMLRSQCDANAPCKNDYACFGTCVPTCSLGCPEGFACDPVRQACTANPRPCTLTSDCTNMDVCVQSRCVAPCGNGNGYQCAGNAVCVAGGCIPDGGQAGAGLDELLRLTPTRRKHCGVLQTSNVQAVAQCSDVPMSMDAGIDAMMDATADSPTDATGN